MIVESASNFHFITSYFIVPWQLWLRLLLGQLIISQSKGSPPGLISMKSSHFFFASIIDLLFKHLGDSRGYSIADLDTSPSPSAAAAILGAARSAAASFAGAIDVAV